MNAVDELNALLGIGPAKPKLPITLQKSGYSAIRVLGKGAFGQAYLIFNQEKQAYFVAKHVNMSTMSSKQRKEAHNEIHILQQLQHPNIVRYVEFCEEHPHLYIVMEYADGGDLYSHLKKVKSLGQALTEPQVINLFVQVAMAVKYMHDRKLLHRDIKSQNIFLTKNHVVKLGDFGISTVLQSTMAMAKTMCGTPCYFSPELCQGLPYNNKSDVWALGVLLYELCANRLPFEAPTVKKLMEDIVKCDPPRIPAAYSELWQLIKRMLYRDPAQRPDVSAVLRTPVLVQKIPEITAMLNELPRVQTSHGRPPAAPGIAEPRTPPEELAIPAPPPRGIPPRISPQPQPAVPVVTEQQPRKDAAPVPNVSPRPVPVVPQVSPRPAAPSKAALHPAAYPHDDTDPTPAYKPALLMHQTQFSSMADEDYLLHNDDDELDRVVRFMASLTAKKSDDVVKNPAAAQVVGRAAVPTNSPPRQATPPPQQFEDPNHFRVDIEALREAQAAPISPLIQRRQAAANNQAAFVHQSIAESIPEEIEGQSPSAHATAHGVKAAQASMATASSIADEDFAINGVCLCGMVSFNSWISLIYGSFTCSCQVCRKFSGSSHGVEWLHLPGTLFPELVSTAKGLHYYSLGSAVNCYFCRECGSSIAMEHEGIEGCVVAKSALDDTSAALLSQFQHTVAH